MSRAGWNSETLSNPTIFGTATISGSVLVADGTALAPGLSFINQNDMGIFRLGANVLGLVGGFGLPMYVGASTYGNLASVSTGNHIIARSGGNIAGLFVFSGGDYQDIRVASSAAGGSANVSWADATGTLDLFLTRVGPSQMGLGGSAGAHDGLLFVNTIRVTNLFDNGSGGNIGFYNNTNFLTGSILTGLPGAVGTAIPAAATITPTATITHITGHSAAIVTINPPGNFTQSGAGGTLYLIFDDILTTWTAGGNIIAAGLPGAIAGRCIAFTYDNATSKWYPSSFA